MMHLSANKRISEHRPDGKLYSSLILKTRFRTPLGKRSEVHITDIRKYHETTVNALRFSLVNYQCRETDKQLLLFAQPRLHAYGHDSSNKLSWMFVAHSTNYFESFSRVDLVMHY